jgi:hypothetical protein
MTHSLVRAHAASAIVLGIAVSSCGAVSASRLARQEAADALVCPEKSVEQVYSARHTAYDYWFEGCGRQVEVHCVSTSERVMCRPYAPTAVPSAN